VALGRVWKLFESRKNPKPRFAKCSKMRQNPQRLVHAVLGDFFLEFFNIIRMQAIREWYHLNYEPY